MEETKKQLANRVKIRFPLNPEEQNGLEAENLWAERVKANRYRILNSPFFVFGVSADDIVTTTRVGDIQQFAGVASRSGHSTYRIFLQGDRTINSGDFKGVWKRLASLRCTYENANDKFISVDVPPAAEVERIYSILEEGERAGIWAFEEGHHSGQ
jgi:hypothetical protein